MAKKEIEQTEIEAPYELPEGWKWVRQNEVCKLTDGEKRTGTEFPYLEVKYLRGKKEKDFVSTGKFIKAGTKVILVDGENSGEVFTVPEDGFMGSTFKSLEISNVNENYLQYFIHTKKDLYRNNKKGSAIPHLDKKLFFSMPFPLPPTLAEQQRIVNRIESMFAKLDEAKEKAQNVLDSFETRKAAILHKAFTGELTAKWRRENDVGDDSWEEKTLGELLFPMTSKNPTGDTFRYIDIDAIDNENQVVRCPKTIVTSEAPSRASRELKENDVLFSMVRPYLKNIAFIDNSLSDCIASTGFYICRCKEVIFPFYLYNFLCSKDAIDYLMQFMKGDNSPSIRKDDLLGMKINLPTLPEQQEIVRILDSVLEKERTAKQAAEAVLEQIDLLKKTILARAFRGEL